MSYGFGGPNQDLLFVLADRALASTAELDTYWSVQHRHPDGERWIELTRYLTREDAEAAVARALERHPGEPLRVHHVRRRT